MPLAQIVSKAGMTIGPKLPPTRKQPSELQPRTNRRTNILMLGANGQIARVVSELFLEHADVRLTLYLRNAGRLKLSGHAKRLRVVEGDLLDSQTLEAAMAGQDVVYANLAGDLAQQARGIVKTMPKVGNKRNCFLNFQSSRACYRVGSVMTFS